MPIVNSIKHSLNYTLIKTTVMSQNIFLKHLPSIKEQSYFLLLLYLVALFKRRFNELHLSI